MIAAKETIYNGYRFRSRLEARWAVFFDVVGMKYEYEKEGYDLGGGVSYLPDFWLSEWKIWAEVKPDVLSTEEILKCQLLAECTGHSCLALVGPPAHAAYRLYYSTEPDPELEMGGDYGKVVLAESISRRRLWYLYGESVDNYGVDDEFAYAVNAARQARFEWGQTPVAPVRPAPPAAAAWRPGDKARHPTYGEGVVIDYLSAEDKITVAFTRPRQIKSFLAKRANLALIYRPS